MATTTNKSQSNSTSSSDFFDILKEYASPAMDVEAMVSFYRKNMDFLTQTQRSSLETLQKIGQLHGEFARQLMEDMNAHYQHMANARSLEERTQMMSDKMQSDLEKMMTHSQDVAEAWSRCCTTLGEKLNTYLKENMDAAQKVSKPKGSKH